MAKQSTKVTREALGEDWIPDWAAPYIAIVDGLGPAFFEHFADRARLRRTGYASVDLLLVLLLFFSTRLGGGLAGLCAGLDKTLRCKLAQIAGRLSLPSQSSVSRVFKAISPELLSPEFMRWLLIDALGGHELLRSPLCHSFDSRGNPWHVYDFDGTVKVFRRRGLPETMELPAPERLSDTLAMPGYSGRKRGQAQFCREMLQHAGSGLWLGGFWAPGDGDRFESARRAVGVVASLADQLGRSIIRFDGAYASWSVVDTCKADGVDFVLRWNNYHPLDFDEVQAMLEAGQWTRVASSESGPERFAQEGGTITNDNGSQARLIVSRFRETTGERGVGTSAGGFRYELFLTSLSAEDWTADQVVTLYFGRIGQENRFAQEDRELDLDRLFSERLAGQAFATLVGLTLWNLQTVAGYRMLRDGLVATPSPTRRAPVTVCGSEANPRESCDERQQIAERMEKYLDLSRFDGSGGFTWSVESGLRCRMNLLMRFKRVRNNMAVFRAPQRACSHCPLRSECSRSRAASLRREVMVPLRGADLPAELSTTPMTSIFRDEPGSRRRRAAHHWLEAEPSKPGPYRVQGPFLVPTELRRHFLRATRELRAYVVPYVGERERPPVAVATTAARRQRRRQTWSERLAWNTVPPHHTTAVRLCYRSRISFEALRRSIGTPSPSD